MSAVPLFDLAPADWAVLRQLLDQALDMSATTRAEWMGKLPADQAHLRGRLEQLLSHADDQATSGEIASGFTLPRLSPQGSNGSAPPPLPPDAGPYRAIRLLGEGGMGRVWLAERTDMLQGRPVALKLPQAAWRHANLAERLAQEREILAVLDHPNIARIYDAGVTADGQPFLALEYVEGQRIDAYAEHHHLGVRERVALFLQVLSAVAHAHARLVVHRDLKPANILVADGGQVRLLDFGIAKLLAAGQDTAGDQTAPAQRAMTPQYAAPEQILGQPIGTAADIYSLGVVLYELLTGSLPYRPKRDSPAALEDTILAGEPMRPSARVTDVRQRRQLHGDLDTVLLKALKKNPAERYPTVQAFADDLAHWLAHRPVAAQPDSAWYHARKFVQRNRLGVSVAAAFVVSLGAALGVATWQARAARAEAAKAGAVTDFLVGLFKANDIEQADGAAKRQQSVQQLLEHSADALETGLAGQPETRAELRRIVGGLLSDLEINDAAIRLQRRHAEDLQARRAAPVDQVTAWRRLGKSLYRNSTLKESRAALERTAPLCAFASADDLRAACLGVTLDVALIDKAEGRVDQAQAAAEGLPSALQQYPASAGDLADTFELLAQIHDLRNQPDEARTFFERALALRRVQWGDHSIRLAQVRYRFGRFLWNVRQVARAEAELNSAWQITRAALGPEHPATARNEMHLGRLQFYIGIGNDGMAHLRHAHQVLVAQADKADPLDVLAARTFLANALVMDSQLDAATAELDQAEAQRRALGSGTGSSATLDLTRALWLAEEGRLAEARALDQRMIDEAVAQFGQRHPYVAERRHRLARVMLAMGDTAGAEREIQAALDTDDGIEGVFGSAKHRVRIAQAQLWLAQGHADRAAAQVDELLALSARTPRPDVFRETLAFLYDTAARAFAATGRQAEAQTQRQLLAQLQSGNRSPPVPP